MQKIRNKGHGALGCVNVLKEVDKITEGDAADRDEQIVDKKELKIYQLIENDDTEEWGLHINIIIGS